jgi:hypothetical protein
MLGSLLPILGHCFAKAGLFRDINSNILSILRNTVNRHAAYDSVDIKFRLPPTRRQSYMHGMPATLETWYTTTVRIKKVARRSRWVNKNKEGF